MPHAGSIAPRFAAVIEGAFGWRHRGRGLFTRVVKALHVSRRIEARRALRRYRHLIAEDFQNRPKGTLLDFNNARESRANADRGQRRVRAGERTFQDA